MQSAGQSSPGPGEELWEGDYTKVCFIGEVTRVILLNRVSVLDFGGLLMTGHGVQSLQLSREL